ncbi:MAG: nucleotidyltransferase domain-containing protein [Caldilineaceae bacterium]
MRTIEVDRVDSIHQSTVLRAALHDLSKGLQALYGAKKPQMILYGSYARGEAHEDSDVDLLLLFNEQVQPGPEIRRLSYLAADLNLRYQLLVSLQPITQAQLHHAVGPFWTNVRREGITIHGL